MRMIYKIALIVTAICIISSGCQKMLDVNSDQTAPTDGKKLTSFDNSLYYLSGIFSQVEKVAERYVILGELRGDLMDITPNASLDLRQINNFEATAANPYVTIKDYYSIINNCNYLISVTDTAIVTGGLKELLRVYAAAKAIRAWTYMQIVLNYGKAIYYEQPILSLDDTSKNYPEYDLNQLSTVLINDLLPLIDVQKPMYEGETNSSGSFLIGELNSTYFYFPIRFLLGELYLWRGEYENAANAYRDLMYLNYSVTNYKNISDGTEPIRSSWNVVNGEFVNVNSKWYNIFYSHSWEILSEIGTTSQYGSGSKLKELSFDNYMIKPSTVSISNWDNQVYYDVNPLYVTSGDLRGVDGSYIYPNLNSSKLTSGVSLKGIDNYIFKYYLRDLQYIQNDPKCELITTCRAGLLYLRYAEAVNRLGKPNLAWAVLKNGLNVTTMSNPSIVPVSEIGNSKPNYMNFDDVRFANNIGIHARGCGHVEKAANYSIPSLPSLQDSVLYVEDMIQKELALETAFEGNRFQDLMRIALRRNDPSYLANLVAQKHQDNQEAIRVKLLNTDNWYLPSK